MCNTREQDPQQNHPDLSSLNELFSTPAAVNPEQPSPSILSWLLWVFNPFQELSRKLDQHKINPLLHRLLKHMTIKPLLE